MCATGSGTSVPSTVTRSAIIQPPKVRWSTKLSVVPSSSSAAMRRWFVVGHVTRAASARSCPRMHDRAAASPSASVSHRYFPRRPVPVIVASEQPGGQVGGPGLVTAYGAGMVHPDRGDGPVRDVLGQPPPDDLDLGKLRHPDQAPSRAFHAAAAALSSASFLVRPTPLPYSLSATITVAVNSLSWSGPVDVTM